MSSKDIDENPVTHSKSLIIIGKETDKVIKELFESLLSRYQIGLQESVKSSKFVFGLH